MFILSQCKKCKLFVKSPPLLQLRKFTIFCSPSILSPIRSIVKPHGLFLRKAQLHGLCYIARVFRRKGGETLHIILHDKPITQTVGRHRRLQELLVDSSRSYARSTDVGHWACGHLELLLLVDVVPSEIIVQQGRIPGVGVVLLLNGQGNLPITSPGMPGPRSLSWDPTKQFHGAQTFQCQVDGMTLDQGVVLRDPINDHLWPKACRAPLGH